MGKLGLPLGHVLLGLAIAAIRIIVQTVTPSGATLGFKPLGGTELILQVQSTAANPTITDQDMAIVQQVIENRLAGLGRLQEWSVQPSEPHQFIVWVPDASQNNSNQSRNIERMMTSVAVLTATTNYYRVSLRS